MGFCGFPLAMSSATQFSPVNEVLDAFYGQYPNGQDRYEQPYQPRLATAVHEDLTTVQPVAPPDPRMIFLDGLGDSLVAVDMTNFATVSQVVVPSTAGPFGVRPTIMGSASEAWVANGGLEVSIADLSAQTVAATILTPSVPPTATPVGIVFTPDGMTAFEGFSYFSSDSSGNNGALVIFDAAARTVKSTFALKYAPTALLMAPDGSTAYLLSNGGMITYYDVLSGTADLSASTYPPGSNAGYPGSTSAVAIHPDGTRLFWNVGASLTVFDLTTRTVANQFTSGLPTTVGRTFSLSQDGGRAYFSDTQGDVVVLDTLFGNILATYTETGASVSVFEGPPQAP